MTLPQNNYISILNSLKEKIRLRRYKAASAVNAELLKLYWEIGNTIHIQETNAGWGAKIIETLAEDLHLEFSDMKGLSVRNLRYMRQFYTTFPNWNALRSELSWTHYRLLLREDRRAPFFS